MDLQDLVPSPRYALLLLFPLTSALKDASASATPLTQSSLQPYFIRQTIANACGTIAIMHALLQGEIIPETGSVLHKIQQQTLNKTPMERAQILEQSIEIDRVHETFAQEGQTAAPNPNEEVDLHFVCFIHHDGKLLQLDGRRDAPVVHGASSGETLLRDACTVVQEQFMQRDPTELRFNMLALAPSPID